jgi:hypothetical protein
MDSLDIKVSLEWGVAIVVTISIAGLAIVYREPLERFLKDIGVKIRINIFGIITIDVEKLLNLEEQAGLGGPAGPAGKPQVGRAELSARDEVLENWASLKQIVTDAALAQEIQLSPAAQIPQAVECLVNAGLIKKGLAELVLVLYEEGKKIVDQPGKKVYVGQASVYRRLVNGLLDWMMRNVITPPKPKEPPPEPPRRTQVGGYFPPPTPGRPTAILVGISGPVRGKQFPVEKEVFRIGASTGSDLVIAGDKYVSGDHAFLRYDKGSLWLADLHSHNGTYINENRLKEAPFILNLGDRLRVGTSTFEVIAAPGR